jgi:flavin-binding protein dodecin
MGDDVPGAVVKVIELVGSSPQSFSEAVRTAVATASQSLRNIKGVEVVSSSAEVDNGQISVYKVTCKIAFLVDAAQVGGDSSSGSGPVPGSVAGGPSGAPGPHAHPGGDPLPVA